jgi:hypothetical protein
MVLLVCLGVTAPAPAQPPANAGPTPEPLPCAPSLGDTPPPLIPPAAAAPSPLSLPGDTLNAFIKPPVHDDHNQLYFGAEYLLWFINKDSLPFPLVTTTSANPPDITRTFGAFYQHETVPLFGGNGLSQGALNGARFTVGAAPNWFLPVEFNAFIVQGGRVNTFKSDAFGEPILIARPINAIQLPQNQHVSFVAAFPELVRGGVKIENTTKLWGLGADVFAQPLLSDVATKGFAVDLLFGVRYLSLSEGLGITNSAYSLDPTVALNFAGNTANTGDIVQVRDLFRTNNTFVGGQIGTRLWLTSGPFIWSLRGNLAVGKTYQVVRNSGSSTLWALDGPPQTISGGILAVATNSGRYAKDDFAVIPEGAINLELPLGNAFRVFVGYNVLYWSSVARPGKQLNPNIDTRQVPTDIDFSPVNHVTQPAFQFHWSDFWAQGLTAGFAITY